ncbi:BamA/TamA family outer membrane protein [Nostoc commune]|uniref:BamA/TamA family outer membrane protein n=1 Tax=Nostoc commune TaxID=1178 RepID=UPI001E6380E8|nr:BamA/TamA family outer membrane protein [Nostoc commune]
MRVQITVIAIAVMLVGGKNPEAVADSQSSTQDGSSGIVTPEATIYIGGYAKYGDYIGATSGDNQTLEFSQKVVKAIQIRFINGKGELLDDKSQPIKGRTQTDFIISLLRLKPAQVDRLGSPLSVSGTGIDDLFTVSFAVSRDQRDRRDNPTKGSILTLSTEQAIPIGLGNISSNRLQGDYIQYLPVSWIGNARPTDNPEMLAINLQIGTTIGDFPPADAFNIGGLNSVRGYGYGKVASGRSYGLAFLCKILF